MGRAWTVIGATGLAGEAARRLLRRAGARAAPRVRTHRTRRAVPGEARPPGRPAPSSFAGVRGAAWPPERLRAAGCARETGRR